MNKQRTKQINTRVTDEEFESIRRKCFDDKITRSNFIRDVILTAINCAPSDGENKA